MTNATHRNEFQLSTIDSDIIGLNFRSVGQEDAFHLLIPAPERRNDGRLTDRYLKTFNRLEAGGWSCNGINLVTMNLSEWGCLKPNEPWWNEAKQKDIKYEHPHGIPTELFCLRVTYQIGLKIAKAQGLEIEAKYLNRMVDVDSTHEDLTFWQWVKDNPTLNITITEGAKKAASLLSAGHLAIAFPGIWGGYRSKINGVGCIPFLIPQLEILAVDGREFVFCFDQDTNPKTIASVNNAIDKTGKLLKHRRCNVSVGGWKHPYKGIDDLIYNLGEEIYHQAFSSRQSLESWRLDKYFDISQLPQTKVHIRYLNPTVKPASLLGKLVAIKGYKGGGKTQWLSDVNDSELNSGRSILILTHRIQLARELAQRVGINHISEIVHSDTGSQFGYALCIDSAHPKSQIKFNPDAWENAIVIIDECEQVLWHMLNSNTCQQNRALILKTFQQLLQNVAESGGTIILADADLSKVSIDLIQNLTDNRLDLWLLTNSYNGNQGKRNLFTYNSPTQMLSAAYTAIERGEKIIINCAAQQTQSKLSTQSIEKVLRNKYPDKKILRVDRETVSDPTHAAHNCIDQINGIVTEYDIIIASPVLETGISITVEHFDSVWCLANGVQSVDAVCQTVERVRSHVDRHICITTKGIRKIGNGSESPYGLIQSEDKVAKANLGALSLAGFRENATNHHLYLDAWSKYAAKKNQGFNNYEEEILTKLQVEGYSISAFEPNINNFTPISEIEADLKIAKTENYQAERDGKLAAPNPDDLELKRLQKKTSKTKQERLTEDKGMLCRRYLTENITDELILKDDAGWYPQIQLFYYLTIGHKHLKDRDTAKLDGLYTESLPFTPDINRVCRSMKIRSLQAVNLEQFFGEDKIFTLESLTAWHDKLKTCRADLKKFLNISIGEKSTPITTAQRLLKLVGLKLVLLDRIRINGVLTYRYGGVDCNVDNRANVLERWLDRDDRLAGMSECSSIPINIYTEVC
jgi:Domain of unknown function (DUF3854)